MTSNRSKQQSVFRVADFVQASVSGSRGIKWFTRKPQIPTTDSIGAITRNLSPLICQKHQTYPEHYLYICDTHKILITLRLRLDQTDGRNERCDEGFEVEIEGAHLDGDNGDENAAAEIEDFRSLLRTALECLDHKLKPSSRSPEEDTGEVRDPMKWTDLGRNFIRVLKDKLDKERSGPGRENEVEIEEAISDHDFDDETEEERAEKESWLEKFIKYTKLKEHIQEWLIQAEYTL